MRRWMRGFERVAIAVVLLVVTFSVASVVVAGAHTPPEAVAPRCVNIEPIVVGRSYPVATVRAGAALTIKRWYVAGEEGGVDVTLRACPGTICGPTLGFWSQEGGGLDSTPLDFNPEPDVVIPGPMNIEALVRVKSATTKGMVVCLE